MTDQENTETSQYTAPEAEHYDLDEDPHTPKRILRIDAYGFDDDVLGEVMFEFNKMFTDDRTAVAVDTPEDKTREEAWVEIDEKLRKRRGDTELQETNQ